jgi:hypothetical protein
MIFQNSRYEYSVVDFFAVTEEGDTNPVVFYKFSNLGLTSWREHIYVEGERLDQISNQYYKRPGFWWIIMEYNPEITDITDIPAGTTLRIPNV